MDDYGCSTNSLATALLAELLKVNASKSGNGAVFSLKECVDRTKGTDWRMVQNFAF